MYVTGTADQMRMDVFGCDKCTSFSSCVDDSFIMHCTKYSLSTSYNYNETCYSSISTSYGECGCNEMIDSSSILRYEPICTSPTYDTGCSSNEDCTVDCDPSCEGKYIDGATYDYLTVNCDDRLGCKDSIIVCPLKGCTISC